ncbi:MAG: histidinol-phosphatase HisJ family protein [Fibrobacterota bacterium]
MTLNQYTDVPLVDYHIHTPYCGHAQGKTIEYVESAVEQGLQEICFTDHLGRYYLTPSQKKRYWDWGMDECQIARYIAEIDDLRDTFEDRISIKTGLEIDYIPGAEEIVSKIIHQYPVDFLLGSIHCIPELGWKHIAHYHLQESWHVYEAYFSQINAACSSGLFDAIAHIDFIWRYIECPSDRHLQLGELIESTVCDACSNDIAIEINANGYLHSLSMTQTFNPFTCLLNSVKRNESLITLGSDAHRPESVGKQFQQIAKLFVRKGIASICCFDKRNRYPLPFAGR